jgi:hypothetical protein
VSVTGPLIGVALVCEALSGVLREGVVSAGGVPEGVCAAAVVSSARAVPANAAVEVARTSSLVRFCSRMMVEGLVLREFSKWGAVNYFTLISIR